MLPLCEARGGKALQVSRMERMSTKCEGLHSKAACERKWKQGGWRATVAALELKLWWQRGREARSGRERGELVGVDDTWGDGGMPEVRRQGGRAKRKFERVTGS